MSESSSISLLAVIVNYATPTLTIDCLCSLQKQREDFPQLRVAVVNAPAEDDSAQQIQDAIAQNNWGDWVTFENLDHNGGFAFGNNAAVRPALSSKNPPNRVWLLNPDTVVKTGALQYLMQLLDEKPQAGLVGSRLQDPDGTPQASAFRFPSALSEWVSTMRLGLVSKCLKRWVVAGPIADVPHPTDWVAGASVLIRREVFEEIGLLDENYFLYYEEVDFCFRAQKAGWQCWYQPQSRVIHLVGAASGISDSRKQSPRRPAYWFESRRRYFIKNFGKLSAAAADLLWLVGFGIWRVRRWVQRKPDLDPPHFMADFFRHSVLCKGGKL